MNTMNLPRLTLPLGLTFALPLLLAGCNGAFLGTLSLGRHSDASRADRSAADGSRSTRPVNDA